MKALFVAAACALVALGSQPARAGDDLLARAAAVNQNLHSYTATLHAHVALTTFPFIATDLVGTYYHKDPSSDKLDITSGLPGMAKQFSKLYPHIVSPGMWSRTFAVTRGADDGTSTAYTLVPRKRGNIDHIDARIDDKTATLSAMTWHYYNGGSAAMNNSYSTIDGNVVVTAQTGSVDEPSYKGNITSTLDGYKMNPPLSDATFTE
ncbi:MAG TPA: hypothetical protein VGN11_02625 [Candidatus Baltobacteraceae bacterium]|jgi:hypothetical protein|nr:hypothetical protein [Candidatus Baltobacteraceae bacterium]